MKAIIILKDDEGQTCEITIDLAINGFTNVQKIYSARTKLIDKEKKTQTATDEALKKAKQSAFNEIRNRQLQSKKKRFMAERKAKWYEKFYWFLSSENYLVISARDAQQNEMLLKRYLAKQDVVFHAQIQGAAFTVVKNHSLEAPVPSLTLLEAATASLSHSKAWESKVVVPVYWVHSHQISKSAPTGMTLSTGSFMIYGKKNFVYPYKLEMGFGLLFKIDEEGITRHTEERHVRNEETRIELSHTELPQEDNKIDELIKKSKQDIEGDGEEVKFFDGKKILKKQQQPTKDSKAKKVAKKDEPKEEISEQTQKGGKKNNKKKQDKINKYMEMFGDESKEDQELRLKMHGYHKNYAFEAQKKEFEWNQQGDDSDVYLIDTNIETKPDEKEVKFEAQIPKEESIEKQEKEKPKFVKTDLEADIQDEEEIELDNYADFTSIPYKEDTIYEVMTVCAPYSTLQNYRYKIKLVPGTMKRGKILQMAFEIFKSIKEENGKEKELIKYIPEKDAVLQLLSYCKVQAPGLLKVSKIIGRPKKADKKAKK